jgi:two-component system sensor histidine kinase BaeS
VGDTGPGIAPEEHAPLFTPFHRVRGADPAHVGMGLGLSIAHDLVAAHGGRLEVESMPGAGSHFTLSIPLDAQQKTKERT